MSKPVVRVVLAVVISLAIIAAIAPSVQARIGSILPSAQVAASDQVIGRTSVSERAAASYYYQFQDTYKESSGGCEHSNSSIDD